MLDINKIHLGDCLELMSDIQDKSVDMVLTDIPYGVVSRKSNGLRNLDKGNADVFELNLSSVLNELVRVSKGQIIIFCGKEQFSEIYSYFANKKGTTRPIVWQKSNPSPMNGQHVYLSGVELAVWFKPRGRKVFNAHCKNTVFKYSNGSRKIHPTQKNLDLWKDLLLDNTNEGELVLDPFIGSGTTAVACENLNRNWIGFELDKEYFELATNRVNITIESKKEKIK